MPNTKVVKNGKLNPIYYNGVCPIYGQGVWLTITNIHWAYANGYGTGQFYTSHTHNMYWVPLTCKVQCKNIYNYCQWPYCNFLTKPKG